MTVRAAPIQCNDAVALFDVSALSSLSGFHATRSRCSGASISRAVDDCFRLLLIVAGILIALAVSDWNDRRLQREEELLLLGEIQSALAVDLAAYGLRPANLNTAAYESLTNINDIDTRVTIDVLRPYYLRYFSNLAFLTSATPLDFEDIRATLALIASELAQ